MLRRTRHILPLGTHLSSHILCSGSACIVWGGFTLLNNFDPTACRRSFFKRAVLQQDDEEDDELEEEDDIMDEEVDCSDPATAVEHHQECADVLPSTSSGGDDDGPLSQKNLVLKEGDGGMRHGRGGRRTISISS